MLKDLFPFSTQSPFSSIFFFSSSLSLTQSTYKWKIIAIAGAEIIRIKMNTCLQKRGAEERRLRNHSCAKWEVECFSVCMLSVQLRCDVAAAQCWKSSLIVPFLLFRWVWRVNVGVGSPLCQCFMFLVLKEIYNKVKKNWMCFFFFY